MHGIKVQDYGNEGTVRTEPRTIRCNLIAIMEICVLKRGMVLVWNLTIWTLTEYWHSEAQWNLNNWWMKTVHLSTLRYSRTGSLSSKYHQLREAVVTRKLVFLRPYFPVTTVFLLCLLIGQWGNIYMLIICHPSISSKAVLVSPQEHHGIIYPCQDPGINDTPLSLWSTR